MMNVVLVLLCSLAVLQAAIVTRQPQGVQPAVVLSKNVGGTWKNCSKYIEIDPITNKSIIAKSTDMAMIRSLVFSPDPPKRGRDVTVTVTAFISKCFAYSTSSIVYLLEETVSSGKIKVKVKDEFIPLIDTSLDLCDLAREVGENCPLKGELTIVVTKSIPSIAIVRYTFIYIYMLK